MKKTDVCIAGVSLRGYKSYENRNEGSFGFSADVAINGMKLGWVSDDGNGGSMVFSSRDLEQQLEAIAATLPDSVATEQEAAMGMREEDGSPMTMKMDAELLISQIADRIEALNALKKLLKNRVLLVRGANKPLQTKTLTAPQLQKDLSDDAKAIRSKWPDARTILNLLPVPEALDAFVAHF